MRILELHSWDVTPKEAVDIQISLYARICLNNKFKKVDKIAGADIAFDPLSQKGFAGVILYQFPDLKVIERTQAILKLSFPYVPGLLAFREAPVLLEAFRFLRHEPDIIFFDGQGIAHPRGMGIASHLGVVLNKPTIGCAKSVLVGKYSEPSQEVGAYSSLIYKENKVGVALRTRKNVRPIFVSPGHKIDLEKSIELVLACCDGYRIPKPTREADHFVAQIKEAEIQRCKETEKKQY
jgi:deoxyribonuclease V